MFDELSSRFEDAVKGLRGEAKISENNINDALKEVKRALLDACLLYTSPSPRDDELSRMPSSA